MLESEGILGAAACVNHACKQWPKPWLQRDKARQINKVARCALLSVDRNTGINWDFSIDSVTCMNHAISRVIEGLVNTGLRTSLQEIHKVFNYVLADCYNTAQ